MSVGHAADDEQAAVVLAVRAEAVHDDLDEGLGGLVPVRGDQIEQLFEALVEVGVPSFDDAVCEEDQSLAYA